MSRLSLDTLLKLAEQGHFHREHNHDGGNCEPCAMLIGCLADLRTLESAPAPRAPEAREPACGIPLDVHPPLHARHRWEHGRRVCREVPDPRTWEPEPAPAEGAEALRGAEAALVRAREALNHDRTGLAKALNLVLDELRGRYWMRHEADGGEAGSWGSYSYEEHTVATLRREIGWAFDAIWKHADDALGASGNLAGVEIRAIEEPLGAVRRALAAASPASGSTESAPCPACGSTAEGLDGCGTHACYPAAPSPEAEGPRACELCGHAAAVHDASGECRALVRDRAVFGANAECGCAGYRAPGRSGGKP